MLNKEIRYEFSQEGLKQFQEDNRRAADVKHLYKVVVASIAGIFVVFLV